MIAFVASLTITSCTRGNSFLSVKIWQFASPNSVIPSLNLCGPLCEIRLVTLIESRNLVFISSTLLCRQNSVIQ